MIEKEPQRIPRRSHRKQGGAFDTLARVFTGVVRIIFRNGVVVEDRPGVKRAEDLERPEAFTKAKSVYEVYQTNQSNEDGLNLMYLGRKGTGDFRNTNYIELHADAISGVEEDKGNGQIILTMSKDGTQRNAQISLFDLKTRSNLNGVNAVMTSVEDGGCLLGYFPTDQSENLTKVFYVGKDGIILQGLPTSNPGGSGLIWNDGGTLKIT